MPKAQSTAGQLARREAHEGAKYTTALRRHATTRPPHGQVVQFLARFLHEHTFVIHGIAAAWAQLGLRVLILSEREYEIRMPTSSRVKGRWVTEEPPEPPGPYSTPHWSAAPGHGQGLLAELNMDWYTHGSGHGPVQETPLQDAVRHARDTFDLTVLVPNTHGDLWHPYELADHFVALADARDLPRHEQHLRMNGTRKVTHRRQLTPQQSAAVLRERHLQFLQRHEVAVHGLVCHGTAQARATDPAFYDAVADDMLTSGVPLLGWITLPGRPRPFGSAPAQQELGDPGFVAAYRPAAQQILTALPHI
ncbi:hypothetical protein [Streptomyces violascens]|uniref:hypothetical protein n=1 Tax=Streptomyces violascens TaxID=67381 RepID=UPI003657754E